MDAVRAQAAPACVRPLVARARGGEAEAARDHAMLAWIARFRFVDAFVLAARFGVSRQQVNARLRRLAAAGLVDRGERHTSAPWTVSVTPRGAIVLGLPARKAPRTDVQREHELTIAWLTARLELASDPPPLLLTERECRHREVTRSERLSADVTEPGRRPGRRLPDLVADQALEAWAFQVGGDAEQLAEVGLWVGVDEQRAPAAGGERDAEVGGGSRFAAAALVVGQDDRRRPGVIVVAHARHGAGGRAVRLARCRARALRVFAALSLWSSSAAVLRRAAAAER